MALVLIVTPTLAMALTEKQATDLGNAMVGRGAKLPTHTAYSNMDKQALNASPASIFLKQFCDKVNHIYSNGSTGPRSAVEIYLCGVVPRGWG